MRIRVDHSTTHKYDVPVRSITQVLRLSPRDNDAQQIASWRISLSTDGRMRQEEDGFGNLVQRYETDGPLQEMTIHVEGVVDTFDTAGILRSRNERVPPQGFLRNTELTMPDEALIEFVKYTTAKTGTELEKLHVLLDTLHENLEAVANTQSAMAGAAAAFASGHGSPRDLAHVFITAARHLEIPARIVTGYHVPANMSGTASALHAWAEAYADGYGWIGFDVAHGLCPTTAHVRIACGLDYADTTPVRGARTGGGKESMNVMVNISGQQ